MKAKILFLMLFLAFLFSLSLATESSALARTKLWSKMCASCHDGNTAISKDAIREKYQTVDVFTEAVLRKGGRCMNILKNDESLIREVAQEIGLKER